MASTELLLFTCEQAAERLQLNRSAIYRAIQTGKLRSCKIGRLRRVSRQALDEFVAREEGRYPHDTLRA